MHVMMNNWNDLLDLSSHLNKPFPLDYEGVEYVLQNTNCHVYFLSVCFSITKKVKYDKLGFVVILLKVFTKHILISLFRVILNAIHCKQVFDLEKWYSIHHIEHRNLIETIRKEIVKIKRSESKYFCFLFQ